MPPQLTEIPESLGRVPSLRQLILSDNRLTALPPFAAANKLETLNVSHNLLASMPEGLDLCRELTDLDVSQNKLKVRRPACTCACACAFHFNLIFLYCMLANRLPSFHLP